MMVRSRRSISHRSILSTGCGTSTAFDTPDGGMYDGMYERNSCRSSLKQAHHGDHLEQRNACNSRRRVEVEPCIGIVGIAAFFVGTEEHVVGAAPVRVAVKADSVDSDPRELPDVRGQKLCWPV